MKNEYQYVMLAVLKEKAVPSSSQLPASSISRMPFDQNNETPKPVMNGTLAIFPSWMRRWKLSDKNVPSALGIQAKTSDYQNDSQSISTLPTLKLN